MFEFKVRFVIVDDLDVLNDRLKDILPIPLASTIPLILNLVNLILAAFETARVYILPRGCIEHFYTMSKVDYMPVSGKDKLFHTEFEAMVNMTSSELRNKYPEITAILEKACSRS